MDNVQSNITSQILQTLEDNLGRPLESDEIDAFKTPRSYMALEMILDFVSDEAKNRKELEDYVQSVTKEYKTTTNNN